MNIVIEGCDAMGKGTQIALIEKEFEKLAAAVHIIHYSNIKLEKLEGALKIIAREL